MRKKTNYYIYFISLFIFACSSNKNGEIIDENNDEIVYNMNPNKINAVDLNNELSLIQISTLKWVDSLFSSDPEIIDVLLKDVLFELEINQSKIKDLPNMEESEAFKNDLNSLLDFYKKEFTETFQNEIIPILKKETYTEEEEIKLEEYDIYFANEEAKIFNKIQQSQIKFANHYKIDLE